VKGRWDREWRQCPIEYIAIRFLTEQAALKNTPGQFLDKQRLAVGAIYDLVDNLIGQGLTAGDLRYQNAPVMPGQTI
jgi:hypothetical protein